MMYLTDKLSEGLSQFENYNNKEIYRFEQLGFTITGRLVSGLSGFLIIVVMLMCTFSSAANSIMVSDLGGSKSFVGDVVVVEEAAPLDTEDDGSDLALSELLQGSCRLSCQTSPVGLHTFWRLAGQDLAHMGGPRPTANFFLMVFLLSSLSALILMISARNF